MLRTRVLLKRAIRDPSKPKRTYKADRSKNKAVRSMLQDRAEKSVSMRGGPIRAGVMLERNPIVIRGGRFGNCFLKSQHCNEEPDETNSTNPEHDRVHHKWQEVVRIQEGKGIVFPSDTGVVDRSELPPQQGRDLREECPDYMLKALEVTADSWGWPPNVVRRKMTETLYFLVKGPKDEHWKVSFL